jgi:hypothetical protein
MDTLSLGEIASWFGAGCGLAIVPYALLYGVRAVWHMVTLFGDEGLSVKDEQ